MDEPMAAHLSGTDCVAREKLGTGTGYTLDARVTSPLRWRDITFTALRSDYPSMPNSGIVSLYNQVVATNEWTNVSWGDWELYYNDPTISWTRTPHPVGWNSAQYFMSGWYWYETSGGLHDPTYGNCRGWLTQVQSFVPMGYELWAVSTPSGTATDWIQLGSGILQPGQVLTIPLPGLDGGSSNPPSALMDPASPPAPAPTDTNQVDWQNVGKIQFANLTTPYL